MERKSNEIVFENRTVAELVKEDFRKANVFKKHGIDFCCGGKRTLAEVCEENIDLEQLQDELQNIETAVGETQHFNFSEWRMDFLSDYIVKVHHRYVRENIPPLIEYTQKVAKVHADTNHELVQIALLFNDLAEELNQHMLKEEQILFPYLKQLADAKRASQFTQPAPFGSVENPIMLMEREHDTAGKILKEIRRLSNDFSIPEHACNTYRISYLKLNEFEEDLHQHIHLENNILFPKAIEVEQKLQNGNSNASTN